MLPIANADMILVRDSGGTDTWTGRTQGAILWEGTADAFYSERSDTQVQGDGANLLIRRSVVISNGDPAIPISPGLEIVLQLHDTGEQITGRVRETGSGSELGGGRRSAAPAGIPDTVATTMLWLEDV